MLPPGTQFFLGEVSSVVQNWVCDPQLELSLCPHPVFQCAVSLFPNCFSSDFVHPILPLAFSLWFLPQGLGSKIPPPGSLSKSSQFSLITPFMHRGLSGIVSHGIALLPSPWVAVVSAAHPCPSWILYNRNYTRFSLRGLHGAWHWDRLSLGC